MARCKYCGRYLGNNMYNKCTEIGKECRKGHTNKMGYWKGY